MTIEKLDFFLSGFVAVVALIAIVQSRLYRENKNTGFPTPFVKVVFFALFVLLCALIIFAIFQNYLN
jgi:uncharacterized membrane protein